MTEAEVNKMFKRSKVKFTSYSKYCFAFKYARRDGWRIHVEYGGNADDIYRYDVSPDPEPFGSVDAWNVVRVYDPAGACVFELYDY